MFQFIDSLIYEAYGRCPNCRIVRDCYISSCLSICYWQEMAVKCSSLKSCRRDPLFVYFFNHFALIGYRMLLFGWTIGRIFFLEKLVHVLRDFLNPRNVRYSCDTVEPNISIPPPANPQDNPMNFNGGHFSRDLTHT